MTIHDPLPVQSLPHPLPFSETAIAAGVYIVGAGPGDPQFLTVRALRLLQQADVILYADSLVPKEILTVTRPDAERIPTSNQTLEQILPIMVERVRQGKSVIRLHSGDPSLYSAIHEQIQTLVQAAIPFEVVPGISAFQLAAARLGVELTIPEVVQTIILTRISGRTQVPPHEELASLAAHRASLCLYLSARHVETAQDKLLEHYPPDTVVAICYRLGWPDEQVWLVPLTEMATATQQKNLIRTTLYLISPALTGMTHTDPPAALSLPLRQARSRLYNPDHSHLFRPH